MSSALSNMGDLYKMQGHMNQAIKFYEESLLKKEISANKENNFTKIYAEIFMKLFKTKMACCDWKDYNKFV